MTLADSDLNLHTHTHTYIPPYNTKLKIHVNFNFIFCADMGQHDVLFDDDEFRSEAFQRSYHYLHTLDGGQQPQPYKPSPLFKPGSKQECLQTLIK